MNQVELTVSVGRRDPGPVRLVATLGIAGMLSGMALAMVFQITKPAIEANKAERLRRGIFEVIPGATTMRRLAYRDGVLATASDDAGATDPITHAAYDQDGRFLAWALVGDGPGFQDTIRVLYGYDPSTRTTTGMQILQSRETPGLGDKIFKDESFVGAFRGLSVEPQIALVKETPTADNQVDAITGATISSRAVIGIINRTNERWQPMLPEPGSEPEAPPPPPPADADAEGGGS